MEKSVDNHNLDRFAVICHICRGDDTSLILDEKGLTIWCNECEEGEEIKL
jgi:hypothetical protein